jgi:hypothetical protein
MLTEFLFVFAVLGLVSLGLGVGVFFFGKTAYREACGRIPGQTECPSQKAGLCPTEDKSGILDMALQTRITDRH